MNKVVIFDSIDVEAAVNNMAFQLNVMLKGQTAVLVPVMIGGLYTAMKIADKMNAPVIMDPVKTRSYNGIHQHSVEFDYAGCMDNQRWVSDSEHTRVDSNRDEGSKRKSMQRVEMPYWMRDSIDFNGHDLT